MLNLFWKFLTQSTDENRQHLAVSIISQPETGHSRNPKSAFTYIWTFVSFSHVRLWPFLILNVTFHTESTYQYMLRLVKRFGPFIRNGLALGKWNAFEGELTFGGQPESMERLRMSIIYLRTFPGPQKTIQKSRRSIVKIKSQIHLHLCPCHTELASTIKRIPDIPLSHWACEHNKTNSRYTPVTLSLRAQ